MGRGGNAAHLGLDRCHEVVDEVGKVLVELRAR
jgi:hypothetical protein